MRIFILLALILSGCTSIKTVLRTDYTLEKFDGLLASNSNSLHSQPVEVDGNLKISYSVLVKNISKSEKYQLHPDQAEFDVRGTTFPAKCKVRSSVDALEPLETCRVDCEILVKPDSRNQLSMKDSEGMLKIPFSFPGNSGDLAFKYYLKIEDFE